MAVPTSGIPWASKKTKLGGAAGVMGGEKKTLFGVHAQERPKASREWVTCARKQQFDWRKLKTELGLGSGWAVWPEIGSTKRWLVGPYRDHNTHSLATKRMPTFSPGAVFLTFAIQYEQNNIPSGRMEKPQLVEAFVCHKHTGRCVQAHWGRGWGGG